MEIENGIDSILVALCWLLIAQFQKPNIEFETRIKINGSIDWFDNIRLIDSYDVSNNDQSRLCSMSEISIEIKLCLQLALYGVLCTNIAWGFRSERMIDT